LTFVVALKGRVEKIDGVVITSDTQVSSNVKSPMKKVFRAENFPFIVGGAGSVSLSRYVTHGLFRLFKEYHKRMQGDLSCEYFDEFVYLNAEPYLREVVLNHHDVIENGHLQLILSFSDKTHVRLFKVHDDGIPTRMDHDPGYCCIGSGFVTGGNLLLKQFYSSDQNLVQLTHLASFLIYQVADVDPYVGGAIQTMLNFGGKTMNPVENLDLQDAKLRSETIRLVWNLLSSHDVDFRKCFKMKLENGELSKLI
jgi:20S proteasome alpha/beta subunit